MNKEIDALVADLASHGRSEETRARLIRAALMEARALGLEEAARFMLSRKVSASQLYADHLRALKGE